jgi:hypothetical protein
MGRAGVGRHQSTLISDILELLMVARKLALDGLNRALLAGGVTGSIAVTAIIF